jgi:5'-phosphate synthase pdxT subunit
MRPKIGVLALQGDFEAHEKALRKSGAEPVLVRTRADLDSVDGLILPGGESTTMLKLLDAEDLFERLRKFGETKPIFGTCAGAILLADNVVNPQQRSLGLIDLTVERNGYGRQIDSRIASIELDGKPAEAVFIRAPIIRRAGPAVRVIASYLDTPVLVENGLHMAATFHPELSRENRIHELFVKQVQNAEKAHLSYTETT